MTINKFQGKTQEEAIAKAKEEFGDCDTLCTCHTHRNHYKYHGNHHKVHKNCHTVGQEAHKLTCCEQHAAGAYNHLRADPVH